jgi:hypothetical protein
MEKHTQQTLAAAIDKDPNRAVLFKSIYGKDTKDSIVESVQSMNTMFNLGDKNMMSQTHKIKLIASTLRSKDAIAMGIDLEKRTVRDRLRAKLGSR